MKGLKLTYHHKPAVVFDSDSPLVFVLVAQLPRHPAKLCLAVLVQDLYVAHSSGVLSDCFDSRTYRFAMVGLMSVGEIRMEACVAYLHSEPSSQVTLALSDTEGGAESEELGSMRRSRGR